MAEETEVGNEFLGAGIAFPFRADRSGKIVMNRVDDHVSQSILLILRTARGERPMRPEFGAGLDRLVFAPLNATTVALVEHEVREALLAFEPRIDLLEVKASSASVERNEVAVQIRYRVRETDSAFNLVFPFYLERGQL